MAIPTFVAASFNGVNNQLSVTVTKPAGVVEGDVMVAQVYKVGGTTEYPVAPAGWTMELEQTGGINSAHYRRIFRKVASGSEPASYDFTVGTATTADLAAGITAYRGVSTSAPVDAKANGSATINGSTHAAPSVTTTKAHGMVLRFVGTSPDTVTWTPPAGHSERYDNSVANSAAIAAADVVQVSAGDAGAATFTPSTSTGQALTATVALRAANVAPNAPILDVPASLDRNVTNRFNLTPSDPDPGDTTSQTDWRYREIGAPTWTTVSKTSPTTYYDFAAGTFLGTDYEIQARTYDALGAVGPYSSSSSFTAGDAPDQPTWTDPINGQTISTASYTGTISAPDVDESEWRLVADNAGVIDEATVLHGPVLKTTGDVRSHTFTGLTNGVTVWWQARTKFGGLWSQWAAVRTPVAYTPPPAPTVTPAASNADGAVSVTVSTPAPGAGEPTVTHVDLYVRDTTGRDTYRPAAGIRWAMFRVPNGVTIDWLAASGINYEYQAVAHGDNGTTAASAWTPIDPDAVATIYYGGY